MSKPLLIMLVLLTFGARAAQAQDPAPAPTSSSLLLKADDFRHYIESFNQNDNDLYPENQFIKNAGAWDFLKDKIPLFECPDRDIEQIYYFRWWTYRKHIEQTPDGFVITEFMPHVKWAGKDNTIDCAASFHITEGRWLHDPRYLDDYLTFWLNKGGSPRAYSCWLADAAWERYLVAGDADFVKGLLPGLVANDQAWEKSHLDPNGLFWQSSDRDGMELSAGGDGYRPTINSYMYGDALAIGHIADLANDTTTATTFRDKAATLKANVQHLLWDNTAQFFKTLPRPHPGAPVATTPTLVEPRELMGYTPWYFNLPDPGYASAWSQVIDPKGFQAPFGLTTCEQRDAKYAVSYQGHPCQWNGPVWPFATSVTLTAMANLLNHDPQTVVTRDDYFNALSTYAMSQHRTREDGVRLPWIDEDLNPATGEWLTRARLKNWKNGTWNPAMGGTERGKDYNHSLYVDLVITGLVGLRPRTDDMVEINPLIPDGKWDYFCLDNVLYHGHLLTIFYDKTGNRYGKGSGLHLFADGREIAQSPQLSHLTAQLPGTNPKATLPPPQN